MSMYRVNIVSVYMRRDSYQFVASGYGFLTLGTILGFLLYNFMPHLASPLFSPPSLSFLFFFPLLPPSFFFPPLSSLLLFFFYNHL